MRGHRTERGDNPTVSRPSLAGLFAPRRPVQAGDPCAVRAGERICVTVRRAIIVRVMNSRLIYDRMQRVTAVAVHAVVMVRHPDRGFPPSEIPAVGRVVLPPWLGDRLTTLAQHATG